MARKLLVALASALVLASCSYERNVAILMTDSPVFAFYADSYNASQDRYHIELQYRPNVSRALAEQTEPPPTLVLGRHLVNDAARSRFVNMDYLFRELILNPSGIYQSLMDRGDFDGRQLLLPIAFNMPLVAYRRGEEKLAKDNFVISLDEIRAASAAGNTIKGANFSRMGFSPRWDADFLMLYARMNGADFREGKPISWNDDGLLASVKGLNAWSSEVNRSARDEEDFQFKYLYLPAYLSVAEGRIRFAYMNSSEYFLLSEERRASLDYRWVAADTSIPVLEDILYAGILRRGKGRSAAESFLKWFLREDTQRLLLERAKQMRTNESVFGIAGGFSSIRSVNEKVMPSFYPTLLGHLPPPQYIQAPPALPTEWPDLSSRVLKPFLLNASGSVPADFDPKADLRRRLDQWKKQAAGS
jgi:ABC-type glycerol-3-phosphate transport system substrate-binding protein